MSKLSKLKGYYDSGLWTVAMVANAVTKNWITAEECLEITGDAYTASATQQEEDYTNLELALAEAIEKQTATEQALADEVAAHEETKKALSDVQAQQDADKTNLELAIAELTETVCLFQETAADTDLDQTAATDTSAVDTTDIAPAEPAEGAEA